MKQQNDPPVNAGKLFKSQSFISTVMMVFVGLGLLLIAVGFTPIGGVCFLVAFVFALTLAIMAFEGKYKIRD
ncbi:MAG: hypothetical protein Q4A71_05500 [Actinomycetaceae bacterium]|nr:hypothetical protein [Actinomycetaceae bacterium]